MNTTHPRNFRHQLQMSSLEDKITADNPVRFIEAFVNHIDPLKIGFQPKILKPKDGLILG